MTRGSFLGALAIVTALLVSCDDAETTNRYEVSGFVRDPSSGDGVGGATVAFTSDTLRRSSTTSSGNGAYAMVVESDVPIGRVRAEKAGFLPAEQSVYFDSATRRVDLVLRPE